MSIDYKPITILKRSDGLYLRDAWPLRIGVSMAMIDEDVGLWLRLSGDMQRLEMTLANAKASYRRDQEDDAVWIGRLVDAEFEPPDWLQEVA